MRDASLFFGVLANEDRLRILWLLFHQPELCVCDFTALLGVPQSRVSRHLRVLHGAGLVADRRDGLWIHYSLRGVEDPLARAQLETLRWSLAGRGDAERLLLALGRRMADKRADTPCA